MGELSIRHAESLHARLAAWAVLWDVPLLAKSIPIRTNPRYRRSLGAYHPTRSQITLASWLLDGGANGHPHPLLDEVLCHEAAHAAVHLVHSGGRPSGELHSAAGASARGARPSGPVAKIREGLSRLSRLSGAFHRAQTSRPTARARVRPHGPEWRAFMMAAGFEPRVRIPEGEMPVALRAERAGKGTWEYRCPVCQATRMARTRVTRWRCRRCVEAGRSGRLVIGRVGGRGDHASPAPSDRRFELPRPS